MDLEMQLIGIVSETKRTAHRFVTIPRDIIY